MGMNTCPMCGKQKVIMWPQFWPYRRGETYYCSEDCMIVDQTKDMKLIHMIAYMRAKKGSKMIKKITDEQKARAVQIAIEGGNPLPYLKSCGSKNPSASWAYIKNCLEKKDPETFAKLHETKEPAQVPKVKLDGQLRIETPEAGKIGVLNIPEDIASSVTAKKEPPAPKSVNGFGLVEIRGTFGTYSWKSGYFAFDPVQYGVPLEYELGEWRVFLRELHNAAELLGVDL